MHAAGGTRLQCEVAAHIGSFGDQSCFQTARQIAQSADVRRTDGREYHPGSVRRARRWLAQANILHHERIMPGKRLDQRCGRYAGTRSYYGTLLTSLNWDTLGQRPPRGRGERRRAREVRDSQLRPRRKDHHGEHARAAIDLDNVPAPSRLADVIGVLESHVAPLQPKPRTPRESSPAPAERRAPSFPRTAEDIDRESAEWLARRHRERGPPKTS